MFLRLLRFVVLLMLYHILLHHTLLYHVVVLHVYFPLLCCAQFYCTERERDFTMLEPASKSDHI